VTPTARESLRDRFRGALVGTAVGDALGAPFEGHAQVPTSDLETLEHDPPNLTFTDDTAMTIGVARSLADRGEFDGAHMAATLAEIHDREPWRGYGAGPPRVFAGLAQGAPWDRAARELFGGEGSFGNGGAMRVAPVALHAYPAVDRAAEVARLSSIITHSHVEGIDGAVAQAVAVTAILSATSPPRAEQLVPTVIDHVASSVFRSKLRHIELNVGVRSLEDLAEVLGTGVAAHASVPTALACFLTHPEGFAGAVTAAIGLGGDTDTIAAMTGALAGAMHGYSTIPDAWKAVEGAAELVSLADSLADRAPRP
jgi:poly(ADP-ribose) glycohydrolase ARH3